MSGGEIKVTDKRMFTADGELREEYRFLEKGATGDPGPGSGLGAEIPADAEVQSPVSPVRPAVEVLTEEPIVPVPGEPRGAGFAPAPIPDKVPERDDEVSEAVPAERFVDLLSMLVEPALMYLGELRVPGAPVGTDMPMARLHIDLLETLELKTRGNLTQEEAATLENALYQVKMLYVRKSGAPT